MNVFYLDKDPVLAASYHCDKHCVKMIVESAQLLSTAHRLLDEDDAHSNLYKVAHKNHPSTRWTRSSEDHYVWLYELFRNLSIEFSNRYDKVHLSWKKLGFILDSLPKNIKKNGWVDPPQCMPDYCKQSDTVEAYRTYYKSEKASFCTWKTQTPTWFTDADLRI